MQQFSTHGERIRRCNRCVQSSIVALPRPSMLRCDCCFKMQTLAEAGKSILPKELPIRPAAPYGRVLQEEPQAARICVRSRSSRDGLRETGSNETRGGVVSSLVKSSRSARRLVFEQNVSLRCKGTQLSKLHCYPYNFSAKVLELTKKSLDLRQLDGES